MLAIAAANWDELHENKATGGGGKGEVELGCCCAESIAEKR